MRASWLVGVLAGFLIVVGSAGGAAKPPRAATYVYDVRVTGTLGTRETNAGTDVGDGPVDLSLTYQLSFARVAVRVNPVTKTARTIVNVKKTGEASGKFSFNSRAAKNACSGTFEFGKLAATMTLTASGERVRPPRFQFQAVTGSRAEDVLLEGIEKAEGKCPVKRPGRVSPPVTPVPAGKGISAYFGELPGVIVRRETWDVKSQPLVRLLAGQPFTIDTGVRRQAIADQCEPGSCARQATARIRVIFTRA